MNLLTDSCCTGSNLINTYREKNMHLCLYSIESKRERMKRKRNIDFFFTTFRLLFWEEAIIKRKEKEFNMPKFFCIIFQIKSEIGRI